MAPNVPWSTVFTFIRCILSAAALSSEEIKNHPAWNILDAFECGDSARDRIIGGTDAALGQLPWIVRLGYSGKFSNEIEWLCGGALLTDRFVITAAHCVRVDPIYDVTHVRVGEHDITRDPDCHMEICANPVQDLKIEKAMTHEQFNTPTFQNDIAIIKLVEPAVLNDYVAPVCLPRDEEQLAPLTLGDSLVVAGWGKTNMTTDEMANILQVLEISVLDPSDCSVFNKRFNWSSTQICAGGIKNKDSCAGDSGGPLTKVFDTIDGPKHVLEGVVSFGPAICGTGSLPGIYVAVTSYIKWILDNIVSKS